jgi:hypothetical protein
MNKKNENRISMFKTVSDYCESNIALINANAGLATIYQRFVDKLDKLLPIAQAQMLNRKGIAQNKKDLRLKLALALEEASGIIMSHFDSINDHDIYTEANVTISRLKTMRDMKLLIHAQTIIDLLTTHQAVLAPFGVDAAYIANITAFRTEFDAIVAAPTMGSNARKTATAELEFLIKEIMAILNKELDNAMLVIKTAKPTVYKTYVNARRIIDNGIRHNAQITGTIKGVVKDETTDQIIADALVEIINTDTLVISNELGEFSIVSVPAGTYDIKVSAGNYEMKTVENVVVALAETAMIEVKLTPNA